MIEELPDVPPAVLLLVCEVAKSKSWEDARKRIKSMLPELRDQSETYQITSIAREAATRDPLELDVHLHGGLDLFDDRFRCPDLDCRLLNADRVSRSMGLIADRIWMTDLLTEKFVNFGRATNAKLDIVLTDTFVLMKLLPLILSGILRFRSPWLVTCSGCKSHFEDQVDVIARKLASKYRREFIESKGAAGAAVIETGSCFEPPMVFHSLPKIDTDRPLVEELAEAVIHQQISSALWVGREAALFGGAIFSNSRIGLAGLLQQEGRFKGKRQFAMLDRERSVEVPWVSELSPEQIVELRQEASKALPVFREKMARALSMSDDGAIDVSKCDELILELRENAAELRSELAAAQGKSSRFWNTTFNLVGLGVSALGLATDQPLASAAGLLPLIQLLVEHEAGHEKDLAKLKSRPSYVLVKAQDILRHAH